MKQCLLLLSAVLSLTGCEPPKIRENFTHAIIHPDGKSGLFVFKREHYYPGQMGIFTSAPTRYIVNQTIIGSYDIASGKVRVLYRRDNADRYVNETTDFRISAIVGTRALVGGNDEHYNWLDINAGTMTPVYLKEELARLGREVGYVYLIDEDGTLVFDNPALGQYMNYSASRQLWVRSASGDYQQVVERPAGSGMNYGFRINELYFYHDRRCHIYNLYTHLKRPCESRDIPTARNYNQTIDFHADDHGSPQPTIARKIEGKWIREEVRIDTSALR